MSLLILLAVSGLLTGCQTTSRHASMFGVPIKEKTDSSANLRVKVVYTITDLPDQAIVTAGDMEERFVDFHDPKKVPLGHITSIEEAVGKVAIHGISTGQIVCYSSLVLPSKPKRGEDWLMVFPDSKVSEYLGKRLSVKGTWLSHSKTGCAVMSYDGYGRVRIGLPIGDVVPKPKTTPTEAEKRAAVMREKTWERTIYGQCVIATGTVYRHLPSLIVHTPAAAAPTDYFFLDERTVKLAKSSWYVKP